MSWLDFLMNLACGQLHWAVSLYHRKQLPSPASVHPTQAVFLPRLQWDPRPAAHHVQEALLPMDLWVELFVWSLGILLPQRLACFFLLASWCAPPLFSHVTLFYPKHYESHLRHSRSCVTRLTSFSCWREASVILFSLSSACLVWNTVFRHSLTNLLLSWVIKSSRIWNQTDFNHVVWRIVLI